MGTMHPVQEHVNTPGIDCLTQRQTEHIEYETIFPPRVLQLNLDNINWFLHSTYTDGKKMGNTTVQEVIEPRTYRVQGRCPNH